jgi:predicted ATP-grasp superfamily ATP-dependent carboligase
MKIVVYEHFTSGALQGGELPAELAAEGDAMLQAMVSDMLDNTPFQPLVIRDSRLPPVKQVDNLLVDTAARYQQIWQQCLAEQDGFLLIAPETDGVLQQLAEAVLAADKTLLGAAPVAIAYCSDKLRCYEWLRQQQIPTIDTQLADDWLRQPAFNTSVVCKPRDGAGCVDTYYFVGSQAAQVYLQQLTKQHRQQQIVQPFIDGLPMSLSLFIDEQVQILSLNQQVLQLDKRITYHGSTVAVPFPDTFSAEQAQALAERLLKALPGLWGFIGIDILISQQQAVVVDINPRLTTSFNQLTDKGLSPAALLYQSLNKICDNAYD